MTPDLSADLHAAGLLPTKEAFWVYGKDGKPDPNKKAMFDSKGEPKF